jgi:predicted unusual protein kinase regulating ubiquinone biosynthesis (AarF/ABC1/UbiB family)
LASTLQAYFRALNYDEKSKLISDLAAVENISSGLKGPQIVRVALKGMGVTGAKIAQVLATHKGLLPEEYAAELNGFKDRAQDMVKMRASELINERLSAITVEEAPTGPDTAAQSIAELDAISREALPVENTDASLGEAARGRLVRQVQFLLQKQSVKVRHIEAMGPELGAGSIKVVYKAVMDDGRTWVVKLRAPGAAYRTRREFEILDGLIASLRENGVLDMPGANQLLDEVKELVLAEMDFKDEAAKESAMIERARRRPWYARLLAPRPYVPNPHSLYVGEDIMVEEFVPTIRFADLPRRSLFGPSQNRIAKLAVKEGMFSLVFDEWLEPDPHSGNRSARRGGLNALLPRLVVMDLGQGEHFPLERLTPLMQAALAVQAKDLPGAAAALLPILQLDDKHTQQEVLSAMTVGLRNRKTGVVEQLMDALLEAEKSGALVRPEYASLQKAFVIYAGYSPYLPDDYIFKALENAVLARLLRDQPVPRGQLAKLWAKRTFLGPAAVRADFEDLFDQLTDSPKS